jgi:hypothetical protein
MAEWCMAHPWMTFWLIVLAMGSLGDMVAEFARGRRKRHLAESQEPRRERGMN